MNLQNIIQNFKDGEPDAFEAIYNLFSKQVFSYCFRYTLSRETAEELTNDVFLHVWKKRDCIDPEIGIKGLIFKVAKNKLSRWLKDISGNRTVLVSMEDCYHQESTYHDQQMEASLDLSALRKAVSCLPPQRQKIFELCKFSEMTYTEVAESLSISKDSVRKHMIEANKTLRSIIETGEYQYYYYLILFFLSL